MNLDEFYAADPKRGTSMEYDYGVHWRRRGSRVRHRVSWIKNTGEVYLLDSTTDEVECIALCSTEDELESRIKGWEDICGTDGSLDWLMAKLVDSSLLDSSLPDTYIGERDERNIGNVTVSVAGAPATPLTHEVHHSPTGMEWGYGGSGPSDLARSLLAHRLGHVPPQRVYQAFKSEVIAKLPKEAFVLTGSEVDEWLDNHYLNAERLEHIREQARDKVDEAESALAAAREALAAAEKGVEQMTLPPGVAPNGE